MPVACLPLLAALTPAKHSVTLIDENIEAIDFERCASCGHRWGHGHDRPAETACGKSSMS